MSEGMNATLRWENVLDEKSDGWELEPLHWFLDEMIRVDKPE
jgi:hypothetical protein